MNSDLTSTHTHNSSMTKEMLRKFTVKQLKEKIKELDLPIKTSHLKLKNDIIEFLYDQYQSISDDDDANGETASETEAHSKNINDHQIGIIDGQPSLETKNASPRDAIFEFVMNRYPPLRNLNSFAQTRQEIEDNRQQKQHQQPKSDGNHQFESILSHNPYLLKSFSGLGESDIRQEHHPMLKSLTSSDLDIVTVGTASCVPGVTRGVSCTALRLQWRRNVNLNSSSGKNNRKGKNDRTFATTGGIWIFDCGESTQVGFTNFVFLSALDFVFFSSQSTFMVMMI